MKIRTTPRYVLQARAKRGAAKGKPANPARIDPTRTGALRRAMIAELRRRFRRLRLELIRKIVDEDALGVGEDPFSPPPMQVANSDLSYAFVINCGGPGSGVPGPCPGGKISAAVGKAVDVAKAVGAKAAHVEHVVKDFAVAQVQKNIEKLPEGAQKAVAAVYTVAKAGTSVAFAGWTASQALAERIAVEKGATAEQAATLRSALATSDILAFKPLSIGLAMAGATAATSALWVVPPVTACYLAKSAVTNPVKTFKAATGLVRDAYKAFTDKHVQVLSANAGDEPGREAAQLISDAVEEHGWSDWYVALYTAALEATGDIQQALALADDIFAEVDAEPEEPTTNAGEWRYKSNPAKVEEFKKWLKEQRERWLKGTFGSAWEQHKDATEDDLWLNYIRAGFYKGQNRAFNDATRTMRGLPNAEPAKLDFYNGTREQFLQSAFGRPEAVEKIKLLAGRSYEDLENVTTDMSTRMTRRLVDGLIQGEGPASIARDLADEVGIAETRSLVIARTELIRAHAEGQLTALQDLGVKEVGVMVEWSTAGDERVCDLCEPLEGVVMTIDEARGMIPRHPNCRCAWIPANVGEDDSAQKDTKDTIDSALATSRARAGETEDDWSPATDVAATRPASIFNESMRGLSRWLTGAVWRK